MSQKKQAKTLKKSCDDDMFLSDSHECKNLPGEFFRKRFIRHFQVLEVSQTSHFSSLPPAYLKILSQLVEYLG